MKRLFVLLSIAAIGLCLSACNTNQGRFWLQNNTQETITHATVSICGQTFQFDAVAPTTRLSKTYKITGDGSFIVSVTTLSGKTLKAEDGYVTNGMDFEHEIAIDSNSIKITAKP